MRQELTRVIEHLQAQLACALGQFDSAAALGQKKKKEESEAHKSRAKEPAARAKET